MKKINDFALSERLKSVLSSMGYLTATEIQEQALPLIMDGKDILASSQTGTGKTGAFLMPLITMIEEAEDNGEDKHALIITPTRELAKQVYTVANQMFGRKNKHKSVTSLLIGGEDMSRQIRQLKQNPKLVIGTPGRINDHLKRKTLKLKQTCFLVLDETDRMLDMGFGIQIDDILKFMPQKRQTILFSATLPKAIVKLSGKYLNDPVRVAVGNPNSIAEKITQSTIHTESKFDTLIDELKKTYGSVIIFVRTQRNAEKMRLKLNSHPYKADALHGGLRQNRRAKVLDSFRSKKCNVLVATDVASRGLDVPHIEHVINYDMPDNPEDYIHRIGRTARADKTGTALSIISRTDKSKWNAVQRFLKGDEDDLISHKKPSKKRKSFKKKGDDKFVTRNKNASGKRRPYKKNNDEDGTASRSNSFDKRRSFRKNDGEENTTNHANASNKRRPFRKNGGEENTTSRANASGKRRPFKKDSGEEGATFQQRPAKKRRSFKESSTLHRANSAEKGQSFKRKNNRTRRD
ncbi:MAG: DEAD/DEAH box helicase [Alphaproteobacteria bacterium]|nr:DEAD/DEAH box helicase [Alphaproteobacteria bacterium]